MAVIFHRLATAEFVAARRWYARRGRSVEARFVAAVEGAVQVIETKPETGVIFEDRYRWVRVRRFPYLLYYATTDGSAVVYAVAHARRRLGYWIRRTNR
jgi:plasmid stabilization system protein ParE